jgi:hypothetical protein
VDKVFLLIYDRKSANVVSMTEYEDVVTATKAEVAAFMTHRENRNIDVVLLAGESEEAIRDSHPQYFCTLEELFARLLRKFEEKLTA